MQRWCGGPRERRPPNIATPHPGLGGDTGVPKSGYPELGVGVPTAQGGAHCWWGDPKCWGPHCWWGAPTGAPKWGEPKNWGGGLFPGGGTAGGGPGGSQKPEGGGHKEGGSPQSGGPQNGGPNDCPHFGGPIGGGEGTRGGSKANAILVHLTPKPGGWGGWTPPKLPQGGGAPSHPPQHQNQPKVQKTPK